MASLGRDVQFLHFCFSSLLRCFEGVHMPRVHRVRYLNTFSRKWSTFEAHVHAVPGWKLLGEEPWQGVMAPFGRDHVQPPQQQAVAPQSLLSISLHCPSSFCSVRYRCGQRHRHQQHVALNWPKRSPQQRTHRARTASDTPPLSIPAGCSSMGSYRSVSPLQGEQFTPGSQTPGAAGTGSQTEDAAGVPGGEALVLRPSTGASRRGGECR